MRRSILTGILTLAIAGCTSSRAHQADQPTASPSVAAAAPAGWCHSVSPAASFCRALAIAAPRATLQLAVAETDARRERGLMGVTRLDAGQGMIFVFPDAVDRRRDFWMKDTLLPLDMVFVRTDGNVSSVSADVPATKPGTPDSDVARRAGLGRYVIELRAGGAHAAGLEPGTRLFIPPIDAPD
jgi:uncharacterized membrane protein (UPF0127 family)